MKTLGELNPDDPCDAPEIPASGVRILWVDDYWDGPLSGIAEWDSRRLRFEIIDRSILGHEDGPRKYWLIALSAEQLAAEERWQDLFCTHVWTGFDYTGRPEHRAPAAEAPKFYERYAARAEPDYSTNHVVGWFHR